MLQRLLDLDKYIGYLINVTLQNHYFDFILPTLREPLTWVPLYIIILIYFPYKYKRVGFWWLLYFILCFAIADFTSASIIKPMVQRLRPCNDPMLQLSIRHLVDCGSGYSFPSSHASNHFALAVFIFHTWAKCRRLFAWVFIFWAASISYAQVYVGVHFPIDVIAGALLGTTVGSIMAYVFNKKFDVSM